MNRNALDKISTCNSFEAHFEFVNTKNVPSADELIVSRMRPKVFDNTYHHHASIELNFLNNCEMDYSFSGQPCTVSENRFVIFWGAVPHSVSAVRGKGSATIVYLSLGQLFNWSLPDSLIAELFNGNVICSKEQISSDIELFDRWLNDYNSGDFSQRQLALGEIQMRVRRLAIEGYGSLLSNPGDNINIGSTGSRGRLEAMLNYIADNFETKISVDDVADAANLSKSYAMGLFRKLVGLPIHEYLIQVRLSHARMLLANTDQKILSVAMASGFRSTSAFYEAFQSRFGNTPATFRRSLRA